MADLFPLAKSLTWQLCRREAIQGSLISPDQLRLQRTVRPFFSEHSCPNNMHWVTHHAQINCHSPSTARWVQIRGRCTSRRPRPAANTHHTLRATARPDRTLYVEHFGPTEYFSCKRSPTRLPHADTTVMPQPSSLTRPISSIHPDGRLWPRSQYVPVLTHRVVIACRKIAPMICPEEGFHFDVLLR